MTERAAFRSGRGVPSEGGAGEPTHELQDPQIAFRFMCGPVGVADGQEREHPLGEVGRYPGGRRPGRDHELMRDGRALVEHLRQDRVVGGIGEQGEELAVRGGLVIPSDVLGNQASLLNAVPDLSQLRGSQLLADGSDGSCLNLDQPVVYGVSPLLTVQQGRCNADAAAFILGVAARQ